MQLSIVIASAHAHTPHADEASDIVTLAAEHAHTASPVMHTMGSSTSSSSRQGASKDASSKIDALASTREAPASEMQAPLTDGTSSGGNATWMFSKYSLAIREERMARRNAMSDAPRAGIPIPIWLWPSTTFSSTSRSPTIDELPLTSPIVLPFTRTSEPSQLAVVTLPFASVSCTPTAWLHVFLTRMPRIWQWIASIRTDAPSGVDALISEKMPA